MRSRQGTNGIVLVLADCARMAGTDRKEGGGRRGGGAYAAPLLSNYCVGRGAGLTEGIWYEQPEAWNFGHAILQSESASIEAKLFAASTLKGKVCFSTCAAWCEFRTVDRMLQITYDLHQLQREELVSLRDSLINLLVLYRTGARPIRTQLCVCLAGLALQMLEWKDVIGLAVQALGTDQHGSVVLLEFLTVLPEEVTDGRKVSLSVSSPSLQCPIALRVYGAHDCNRRMNCRIEHRSC